MSLSAFQQAVRCCPRLGLVKGSTTEPLDNEVALTFHPQGKSFLRGIFGSMNSAAFNCLLDEDLLLRREINFHAPNVGG